MAGSLAAATTSRVDSASKHIVPCKVNTDYMASLVNQSNNDAMRELQINKHKYCMHKDDLAIGLGRPLYGSSMFSTKKKAYKSVIVTLAAMEPEVRRWIALTNFIVDSPDTLQQYKQDVDAALDLAANVNAENREQQIRDMALRDYPDLDVDDTADPPITAENVYVMNRKQREVRDKMIQIISSMDAAKARRIKSQISNLLEFYVAGVALGQAMAHPHSGDTVASVMIGGLRTVLNGHFQVHTNDLLMFYWDDELPVFEENGGRINRHVLHVDMIQAALDNDAFRALIGNREMENLGKRGVKRKNFHDMGNGNFMTLPGPGGKHGGQGKIHVARIKPYIVSRHSDDRGRPQHFPFDKSRIFAKAISNAQPFEMLDIMLARQSL